ncbi:MAG: hypothetical protein ACTS43_01770 [Candidatus Hodgkinia cicadicola]
MLTLTDHEPQLASSTSFLNCNFPINFRPQQSSPHWNSRSAEVGRNNINLRSFCSDVVKRNSDVRLTQSSYQHRNTTRRSMYLRRDLPSKR